MLGLLELFKKNRAISKTEFKIKENPYIDVSEIRRKSRFIGFETNLRRNIGDKIF